MKKKRVLFYSHLTVGIILVLSGLLVWFLQ